MYLMYLTHLGHHKKGRIIKKEEEEEDDDDDDDDDDDEEEEARAQPSHKDERGRENKRTFPPIPARLW